MNRLPLSFLLVGIALPLHAAGAEPLTFQGAIDRALGQHPDLARAKEAIAGAQAHAASIRDKRYPALNIAANGSLYREPYSLPFGGMSFVLHDRLTSVTSVTIAQPLAGLAYLSELVGQADHQTAAAKDEYDRVRLDTAYKTAEAYVRVLEARASADVAHQSIADIQSGLDRATQLRQADVYTDIDVLRFKSARAAAEQAALKADAAAETAVASLVVALGMRDGSPVELSDDMPATPPPMAMTLDVAQSRALSTRPELRQAHEQLDAADASVRAARLHYLPDLRAVGVWQHLTGVQPFQPENEEFVGLQLNWNVWDWGSIRDSVEEARHAKNAATISTETLANQVRLDVRKRWTEAKVAFDSLASATTQQQTAEEAFRLQKVKFEAGAATTTDVLDAETETARARLTFALARYDYYLALVGLARAVGDLPKS